MEIKKEIMSYIYKPYYETHILTHRYIIDFGFLISDIEITWKHNMYTSSINHKICHINKIIIEQDKTKVELDVTDVMSDVYKDAHTLRDRFSVLHDKRFLIADMTDDEKELINDVSIYIDDNIYHEIEKLDIILLGI